MPFYTFMKVYLKDLVTLHASLILLRELLERKKKPWIKTVNKYKSNIKYIENIHLISYWFEYKSFLYTIHNSALFDETERNK